MVTRKALLMTLATSCLIYGSLANANSHTIGIGYAKSKIAKVTKLQGANVYYRYEWDSPISIVGTFTYMRGDDSLPSFLDYNSRAIQSTDGGPPKRYLFAKYSGPVTEKPDAKYFSLMLGPAYRINDYVSIYGLLGISHTSFNAKRWTDSYLLNRPYIVSAENKQPSYPGISANDVDQVGKHVSIRVPQKTNNIAYGAGIEVNPVKNISLYFNYEGSITKYQKMTTDPFAYEILANGRNGPYDTKSAKTKLIHGFNIGIGYKF
ncbi:Ail/Lom family outer membrane beta-barrel protein [Xenorhabdus budapestensis]|uniref:Virulence membrane protein PagC n=1 Tax=Xenorhabdus budapestensis TaxID=290110 RepID=A0A2D0IZY7_XENBU|nr:Ail/Lom family outer membrane beta-barrel protein [Xenorhabdus budapestensis]PHM27519.1 virulence membrane protein PagC [Xenorhabdus budapestensis]